MADKISCWQFLLPLWTAVIQAQSTSRLHDSCVYSFSVPKAQLPQSSLLGSGCPGMTQLEQEFQEMKRTVRLQQEQMATILSQLSLVFVEYTKLNSRRDEELERLQRRNVLQQEQLASLMSQQSMVAVECAKNRNELIRLLQQFVNSTDSGISNTKSSTKPTESLGQGAVTYIRWGRTVCPAHAQRIYVGYAGGSWYQHEGGGANYLCLPQEPQWTNKTMNEFQGWSKVYGTEYQLSAFVSKEHNSGKDHAEQDVPCAACYVPQRSAQIMIPGLVKCPTGWTLEYKGNIVTDSDAHKHSVVYECLDEASEVVNGGGANVDGAMMYTVEVHCGSLPCPKYVHGWELSCVVCTK